MEECALQPSGLDNEEETHTAAAYASFAHTHIHTQKAAGLLGYSL